jgi:hypothetical protein
MLQFENVEAEILFCLPENRRDHAELWDKHLYELRRDWSLVFRVDCLRFLAEDDLLSNRDIDVQQAPVDESSGVMESYRSRKSGLSVLSETILKRLLMDSRKLAGLLM